MVLNQHLLCAVIYQHFIMPAPPRFIDYSKLKECSLGSIQDEQHMWHIDYHTEHNFINSPSFFSNLLNLMLISTFSIVTFLKQNGPYSHF